MIPQKPEDPQWTANSLQKINRALDLLDELHKSLITLPGLPSQYQYYPVKELEGLLKVMALNNERYLQSKIEEEAL